MSGGGTVAAKKAVQHRLTRSAITKAQGGKWSSEFWSGFAASGFASPSLYDIISKNCQDFADHVAAKIRWSQR